MRRNYNYRDYAFAPAPSRAYYAPRVAPGYTRELAADTFRSTTTDIVMLLVGLVLLYFWMTSQAKKKDKDEFNQNDSDPINSLATKFRVALKGNFYTQFVDVDEMACYAAAAQINKLGGNDWKVVWDKVKTAYQKGYSDDLVSAIEAGLVEVKRKKFYSILQNGDGGSGAVFQDNGNIASNSDAGGKYIYAKSSESFRKAASWAIKDKVAAFDKGDYLGLATGKEFYNDEQHKDSQGLIEVELKDSEIPAKVRAFLNTNGGAKLKSDLSQNGAIKLWVKKYTVEYGNAPASGNSSSDTGSNPKYTFSSNIKDKDVWANKVDSIVYLRSEPATGNNKVVKKITKGKYLGVATGKIYKPSNDSNTWQAEISVDGSKLWAIMRFITSKKPLSGIDISELQMSKTAQVWFENNIGNYQPVTVPKGFFIGKFLYQEKRVGGKIYFQDIDDKQGYTYNTNVLIV